MNIDEFIERTQERAKEHRYRADFFGSDNPMRTVCTKSAEDCEWLADCLTKFNEYQQLEEQGRLIKLPCKVGDTVYVVDNCIQIKPAECRIGLIGYTATLEDKGFNFVAEFEKDSSIIEEFEDKDIGKTVFLTQSEAEAKLKELRGGENE